MHGILYSFLETFMRDKMIEFRETCPHWIKYDIYDALSRELRLEYLDQIALPSVLMRPHEKKVIVECCCLYSRKDCSEHYPKTCDYMMNKWYEMAMDDFRRISEE